MQKAKVSLCMLENAKSWYKDNNESKITLTVHFFHILTNVRYVEFTSNTYIIDTTREKIYQEYDSVLL